MSFAERIKQLRLERGLHQIDLADMFDVKRTTVGKWETGINKPPADLVIEIAKRFRVTTDWLLGNSDYKTLGEYFNSNFEVKNLAKEVRELELLELFNTLNEDGQKELIYRTRELAELKKYKV